MNCLFQKGSWNEDPFQTWKAPPPLPATFPPPHSKPEIYTCLIKSLLSFVSWASFLYICTRWVSGWRVLSEIQVCGYSKGGCFLSRWVFIAFVELFLNQDVSFRKVSTVYTLEISFHKNVMNDTSVRENRLYKATLNSFQKFFYLSRSYVSQKTKNFITETFWKLLKWLNF